MTSPTATNPDMRCDRFSHDIRVLKRFIKTGLFTCLTALLLTGCQTNTAIQTAQDAYKRGHYKQSLDLSLGLQNSSAPLRAEAAYISGLSYRKLGQQDVALIHLKRATGSLDPSLAGRAYAEIGLLESERLKFTSSVEALRMAESKLTGEEGIQATFNLAVNLQRLGKFSEAKIKLQQVMRSQADYRILEEAKELSTAFAFSLQAGAFKSKVNAEALVKQLKTELTAHRLEAPRIAASRNDRNQIIHVVQIGRFKNYMDAYRLQKSMKSSTYITLLSQR